MLFALPPHTGDSLLVLPGFHLPLVTLTFNISNKLPGGRNPQLHHCFPIRAEPAGPDTPCQEFVDVFSLMKSEGWCLSIDIVVSSDKTPTAGTALHQRMTPGASTAAHSTPGGAGSNLGYGAGRSGVVPAGSSAAGPSGVAASCWHYYQPYTIPHAFIGEFQMKYIIEMVETLANPTAVVRISRKLKPFYARDRRPEAAAAAKALAAVRSQIVQMPLLKQRVDISLLADVYRVHHDAQDSEDPSDMVYIHLSRWVTCGRLVGGDQCFCQTEHLELSLLHVTAAYHCTTLAARLPQAVIVGCSLDSIMHDTTRCSFHCTRVSLQCTLHEHIHILAVQAHNAAQQWQPPQGIHASVYGKSDSRSL